MTDKELEAFLAKGGKVQKVDPTESSGLTGRDWYKASQGKPTAAIRAHTRQGREDADFEVENEAEREREVFAEALHASGSSHRAMQDLNDYRASKRRPTRSRSRVKPNWEAQARYDEEWGQ